MATRRFKLAELEKLRARRHVCFAEQLRSANRAINRFYGDYLGDTDIGIAQLSILIRLYYAEDGAPISRLASNLEVDRTTLTRNLQLLERSGHVEIVPGDNRRTRLARLTEQGFASLKAALPRWQRAQRDLLDMLGEASWNGLLRDLRKLATLDAPASGTERSGENTA